MDIDEKVGRARHRIGRDGELMPDATSYRDTVRLIQRYLLGADWMVVGPMSGLQANTCIVDDIKNKYPPAKTRKGRHER